MTPITEAAEPLAVATTRAVAMEAVRGLTSPQRSLSPWLFYDALGSHLFEQITELPEYYLTRIEREILAAHADAILMHLVRPLTIVELGAGTAAKTGLLLRAAVRFQKEVIYQPIDVSATALEEAVENIERNIRGVTVLPQVVDYTSAAISIERPANHSALALYIGSSIGNFAPEEAARILRNLRSQLKPGDALLLGADLAPEPRKPVETLLAAYDDASGVTAAFNRNILTRLNRDLRADFRPESFRHKARWNARESRIEMHLESLIPQLVHVPASAATPALNLQFMPGDTIHTENSYKFTKPALDHLLQASGFAATTTWHDPRQWFAVTLAVAI